MNELRFHPAYGELCQAIAELSLVSHAPTQSYQLAPPEDREATPPRWRVNNRRGPVPHLGSHHAKGGDTMEPRGGDRDKPRFPGPKASAKLIAEYREDYASWLASYQRKTPDYFRLEVKKCETVERLVELRDECRAVVVAWKRAPLPVGQEPLSVKDPNWKRWVAESDLDGGTIARRFSVSRQYVHQIRKEYREAA